MGHRRTFGRRVEMQARISPAPMRSESRAPEDHPSAFAGATKPLLSVEDEIRAWKSQRRAAARFPWRTFSLMAGLCFGIASFVLPASVNDAMQWPLYALTAISLYAGLHKKKSA